MKVILRVNVAGTFGMVISYVGNLDISPVDHLTIIGIPFFKETFGYNADKNIYFLEMVTSARIPMDSLSGIQERLWKRGFLLGNIYTTKSDGLDNDEYWKIIKILRQ